MGTSISLTIMTTCSRPFARARSPIFSQYLADECSSPSIMVEPWEKKCTGAILPFFVFPTAILCVVATLARYYKCVVEEFRGDVLAVDLNCDSRNMCTTKRIFLDENHRHRTASISSPQYSIVNNYNRPYGSCKY